MPRTPAQLVQAEPGPGFRIEYDGRQILALPGQSIAAALWAAEILTWRTTRIQGRPRGVFCGIGVCFDCLVMINGRPNQRACLAPAREGDVITVQEGHGRAELVR